MEERRKLPRTATQIPIRLVQSPQAAEIQTYSYNLSGSGVYCEVRQFLPLMSKVKLTLLLPGEDRTKPAQPVTCDGAVVRVDPLQTTAEGGAIFRIAIFFTEITAANRERIVRYVEHHLSDDPTRRGGTPPITPHL